jgi:hypothetical protein
VGGGEEEVIEQILRLYNYKGRQRPSRKSRDAGSKCSGRPGIGCREGWKSKGMCFTYVREIIRVLKGPFTLNPRTLGICLGPQNYVGIQDQLERPHKC